MAKDPVCGMQVNEQQAREGGLTSEYEGKTFYFCNPGCKSDFEKDPQQYAKEQQQKS
ncbi:MAG: YHS domain-containing protein [Chloroflexota bacterium]